MLSYLISGFPVLSALIFILAAEWIFIRSLMRRDGTIHIFELGVMYSIVVLTYCMFPGIEFLLGGLSFSVLGEFRLFQADPSPEQLAPIFWYYAVYLACFVLAYTRFRGTETSDQRPIFGLNRRWFWIFVVGYASTYLFFAVLSVFWNLKTPETYGETYLVYGSLPPVLQGIANHMIGVAVLFQLLLMAFLVLNYRKYRRYIYFWLLLEFGSIALFGVGSRTGLMVLLLSLLITYDRYVKRLSMKTVGSVGLILLILFVGLGIVRALGSAADAPGSSVFVSGNEFDNLFANAYDLKELKAAGETNEISPQFYFADFMRMLPDGLVPRLQIDPSQWYVQNFYPAYADRGGGFAFGAISECVVGLGWIDVIWRGLLVGWVFGFIHRCFVTGRNSFWNYAFYLWVTVFCYQTFRVTTFNLVPRALFILFALWCGRVVMGFLRLPQRRPQDFHVDAGLPAQPGES
jgi:hypothetical protein